MALPTPKGPWLRLADHHDHGRNDLSGGRWIRTVFLGAGLGCGLPVGVSGFAQQTNQHNKLVLTWRVLSGSD